MPSLAPIALHLLGHLSRIGPARSFAKAAREPRRAQEDKLREIAGRNAGTEYGRAQGLEGSLSPQQFAARVPLMTPADLEPLVRREMEGARGVLTHDPPVYYVRTTGSTGVPKHVPITRSYVAEFQRTVHVSLYHLRRKFPAAFRGRALYFVGSRAVARAPDGCDIGTMSGFNFTEMPNLVRGVYAWPYELFEVQSLDARSFLSLLFAAVGDVTLIAGIFPAPIVYLLRDLAARCEPLARALHDGELPASLELEPARRALFTQLLGGQNPKLARRLERAGQAPEDQRCAIALPNLRLIYCWTTATAGLYLPELKRRAGPGVAVRDAIYSACEGWCSIPMGDEEPGGALAIDSHFFEFIPEEEFASGSRQTRFAWELEQGKRYLIVITNSTGLYRYLLGDIIEVCGSYRSTPRIRFVRKLGAASNLLGEKLDESHVSRAMAVALESVGAEATFFTLVPDTSAIEAGKPGYLLLLESNASPAQRDELRVRADLALGEASFDYARLRGGNQLAPLKLISLPIGTYQRVRETRVRDGSAEAQLKVAHLVSDMGQLAPELRAAIGP